MSSMRRSLSSCKTHSTRSAPASSQLTLKHDTSPQHQRRLSGQPCYRAGGCVSSTSASPSSRTAVATSSNPRELAADLAHFCASVICASAGWKTVPSAAGGGRDCGVGARPARNRGPVCSLQV